MTDILYKYRSIENFRNFVDIILKNRLYAASYQDLNDPMEGQYYYQSGKLDKEIRDKLYDEKQRLKLCSLSKVNDNELMWFHYADGHRGVAIGLRINEKQSIVKPIEYTGLTHIKSQDYNSQTAIEILSHKLEVWNYEEEVRAFIENEKFITVQIEEIITGRKMSDLDYEFIQQLIKKINPKIKIRKAVEIMGY